MQARVIAVVLVMVVLALVPWRATGQNQGCAEARTLCPNPGMCFMTAEAQQAWADAQGCTFITQEMLDAVNPGKADSNREILAAMNRLARMYGVQSASQIAHVLSQMAHESGLNAKRVESLHYSPARMREIFGCRGGPRNYNSRTDDCTNGRLRPKLWDQEDTYARNARNLGSYVYANRLGNGDEASGDGYAFRGRGPIQLTGRAQYQAFQDHWNQMNPHDQQSFVDNPDLLVENTEYAMSSAFHWWTLRNANGIADGGTVCQVTCRVNGGSNGFKDRQNRYNAVACMLGLPQDSGSCSC